MPENIEIKIVNLESDYELSSTYSTDKLLISVFIPGLDRCSYSVPVSIPLPSNENSDYMTNPIRLVNAIDY